MASKKSIYSLNIGSQALTLAEFQPSQGGGLVLNSFKRTELLADPGNDATRLAQIRLALSEMREALKIKKGATLNYALSGQSVFARFVKLPSIAEEKVDQIIGFEAQQNVPFPINEVVWDYQLVAGTGASSEVEVVLVAIKSDVLGEINDSVQAAGFQPKIIDVAPMALYNAFRYSYSDVTECSLVLDIGARTTNLIIIESGAVFSRSIPIGGNTITTAIAKEFNSSFAVAEDRKKRDGFVSLGGAYADPEDPDVAMVSKLIRNTMTRLHAEVSRSISFYKSQQGGSSPVRVLLSGGSCGLPYMKEFFQEKLQLPLEYFNPLRNVSVTQNVHIDEVMKSAHLMGEVVGLSLRNINNCPMELNLRPANVVRAQKIGEKRPVLVMAALALLFGLAGWWLYLEAATKLKRQALEKMTPMVATMQGFEGKLKQVDKEIAAYKAKAEPLIQIIDDRSYWATVIDELNKKLPPEFIWITKLQPTSQGKPVSIAIRGKGGPSGGPTGGEPEGGGGDFILIDGLQIKGLYLFNDPRQAQVIIDFINNLANSPVFDIDPTKQAEIIRKSETANSAEWAFEYELQVKLKRPIAL